MLPESYKFLKELQQMCFMMHLKHCKSTNCAFVILLKSLQSHVLHYADVPADQSLKLYLNSTFQTNWNATQSAQQVNEKETWDL